MHDVMFASLPRALRCTAINGGDGLPLACAPPPSCIRGPSIRRAPVVPRQTAFWGPCSASPCGGAPRAPRAALVPHAPARPRPRARRCLPPHPPPARGASLQAARVIYMRRVTRAPPGHHKFPSLSIFASRWRFILINPNLQVCVCTSAGFHVAYVRVVSRRLCVVRTWVGWGCGARSRRGGPVPL